MVNRVVIRLIKEKLPRALTILGVSNVSFGLPPVGREVLNAVYLYHCTQAGLDYAIVNTEKLERFASIPKEEVKMAEELLFGQLAKGGHLIIRVEDDKLAFDIKGKEVPVS